MNFKKILCSILAVAMIMSMMGTLVFAEDEVVAIPEDAPELTDVELSEEPADEADVQLLSDSSEPSAQEGEVAKVGNDTFTSIDDAVAAWVAANGSTLTLLSDVTLSKTIELKSTEYHILDLGTYTMTGADKKSVISIIPAGRSSASYALDIKADSENPGGITAVGSGSSFSPVACILSKGNGTKDRPITRIYGGNFKGSYAIHHSGSNGSKCPSFYIYGGTFDAPISTNRAILQISGGTFNKTNSISPDNTAYTQITGGRFYELNNNKMSNLEESVKWIYASQKVNDFNALNYDVTVYVDADGYYVVEKDEAKVPEFEAVVSVSEERRQDQLISTLVFSKAYKEGLGYVKAPAAVENTSKGKIVLKEVIDTDITPSGELTIDITNENAAFTGDVALMSEDATFSVIYEQSRPYTGTVTACEGHALKITEETLGTDTVSLFSGTTPTYIKRTYKSVDPVAKIGDDKYYADFAEALSALGENETLTLLDNVTITEKWNTNPNDTDLDIDLPCTIDGGENKYTIKFACEIFDRNNYTAAFRATAPVTFKNLIIDMSEATHNSIWTRAISASSNLTVDNCTFIGNPNAKKPVAIVYGEGSNAVIDDVEVSITNCEFVNWSRRTIGDNERGTDVKKVTVTGCTFNGSLVALSASEEIVFTGNALKDSNLSITSYTDKESLKVTATGNTINESGTVDGLTYKVQAIGEGVYVQKEIGTYVAAYNGEEYFDFNDALEAAKAAIAASETASRDILLYNSIADVNDDTLYRVYDEPTEGQVLITFNFGGGTNTGNFVSESFILNYGEEINAPTEFSREGYIFRGWDKEVQKQAYAPTTYTAVWVSEEDYGFKTVLTPVGGTKVSGENAIKIDPKGSFLIEVSIEDLHGDAPWNVAEVTMDYDSNLFIWNPSGSSVEAVDENTLRFKVYGADKVDGKVIKQLSFTAKSETAGDYSGAFKVTEATVDTGWAANTIDATPAEEGEATVYIFYSFSVALGDGLSGAPTATTDKDYTGQIVGYDDEYNYVMTGTSGTTPLTITFDSTGKFTVTKDQIVGDMVINVEKTGLKGITADDVELYEYVGDKYVLVLLNADKNRVYTYNGSLMYLTPHYDTVAGEKVHYGYLVKGTDFALDATGSSLLNTPANKALALAKIGRHKTAAANLSLGNAEVGNVNNSTNLDVNDIQAVWNCYNVEEGNDGVSVNVNMPLYLRSDICGHNAGGRDKKVDSADVNAVRAMYDCKKNGGTVEVTDAVLAQCGVEGATYAITLHNADGTTVELVKSTTGISATNDPTAEGHNYAEAHFDSAKKLYVETCTVCGGKVETAITETSVDELFPTPKFNGKGKIYGDANVSTAEDLLFINTLDEKGALAHGEGQRTIIYINDNIDLAGQAWRPLNGHWVTINGNNNTLSNFTVEGAQAGLVSYAGACIISDLTLKDITVTGGQAGAFLGNGEGGSVKNCRLEGTININWKKYYDSAAVGIVAGLHYGSGEYSVTIAEDAEIQVSAEDFETVLGEKGWTTEKAPYIGYVTKIDNLNCTITDNRPNV